MAVAERIAAVRARIAAAAARAGRDPDTVTLIAVGKTHTARTIAEAVAAGVLDLGENRVQEAAGKRPEIGDAARWHLIGPLQRNKVGPALVTFDVVHTLDRPELVERLELLLERDWPDRVLPVLVEVNVGRERQKAGASPDEVAGLVRLAAGSRRLEPVGLMAIPPFGAEPEASRPFFKDLATLADRLRDDLGLPLAALSMGMSADFEIAIEEGATMVRVGTAIFGHRD